jgi:ketosteroid isomerase-like protein
LVLPPDQELAKGRAGAEKIFGGMLKTGVKSVGLHTETVERAGDYAIETGTVRVTVQPEGKEAQTSNGKYVVVWQRQSDRSWQLHRDIWNDNPQSKN